ncbi:MAG: hypothetical protein JWO31_2665, partial [Phycisphaerales bacterium]|nr:hypothetical protein [Phycisphaerales bacterium]
MAATKDMERRTVAERGSLLGTPASPARVRIPCHNRRVGSRPFLPSLIVLHFLAAALPAQTVTFSRPLDGYVRPGTAAAVRVDADGLSGPDLTLAGDGVVTVRLPVTAGRVAATVPLLPTADADPVELRWASGAAAGAAPLPPARRLTVND